MSIPNASFSPHHDGHPLDILEQLISPYEWACERLGPTELAVQAPGQWCDYALFFTWSDTLTALHVACALDLRTPSGQRTRIYELIALANDRLWVGHFSLDAETGSPSYRHTLLMRGLQTLPGATLEDLIDIALTECERFYPAFQFALWGGKTPQEALDAAMLNCLGDA